MFHIGVSAGSCPRRFSLIAPVDLDPKEYIQTLDLLKQIDFLKDVPDEELKSILFSVQKQSFPPNKTILFQGEIANRLFVIRGGGVVITTRAKGQKVTLAELNATTYFGEISLLTPMSATATVTASDKGADLIIITHDTVTALAKRIPDIQERIQKTIDSRLASKKKATQDEEPAEQNN